MSGLEKGLLWFISFLVFLLILVIAYKISYKLGIKKALYRTTYLLLSVIFAFILTPLVNDGLFKMDLTPFNITLKYGDETFTTLIDYLEEVVVHSDFLNDIYAYFPSLKDLFMDFPEVILAPVTYMLLFVVFLILWLPLYLYLSYKRKRRVLYEREDNKKHRIWAGILGSAQCVFLFSVILTPINGFNRVYHAAIEETLDEEYHSLCAEITSLNKYSYICDAIDLYDSTVFANLGGKWTADNYVFDALTRISYDDGYTSIAKEASLIMKGTIVLNQSGLIDTLTSKEEIIPMDLILNNNLTEEDIDVILDTLGESKYSRDVLIELGDLAVNTLDNILSNFIGYKDFKIDANLTSEEIISEIKAILKAVSVVSSTNLYSELLAVKEVIVEFSENYPQYLINDVTVFKFICDLVNCVDIDDFIMLCEHLMESNIFSETIPYIIDMFFGEFGFNFVNTRGDVLYQLGNYMEFGKMVKRHQPIDFFELVIKLSDDELNLLGELFERVANSSETVGFIDFIFRNAFKEFENPPMDVIYSIEDWKGEMDELRELSIFMYKLNWKEEADMEIALSLLSRKDECKVGEIFWNILIANMPYFIESIVQGGY